MEKLILKLFDVECYQDYLQIGISCLIVGIILIINIFMKVNIDYFTLSSIKEQPVIFVVFSVAIFTILLFFSFIFIYKTCKLESNNEKLNII